MRSYNKPKTGKSYKDFGRKLSSKVRNIVLTERVRLVPIPDASTVELFIGDRSHGIFASHADAMSHVSGSQMMKVAPKRKKARRWGHEYEVVAVPRSSKVRLFVDGELEGIFSNAKEAADYVCEEFKPPLAGSNETDLVFW